MFRSCRSGSPERGDVRHRLGDAYTRYRASQTLGRADAAQHAAQHAASMDDMVEMLRAAQEEQREALRLRLGGAPAPVEFIVTDDPAGREPRGGAATAVDDVTDMGELQEVPSSPSDRTGGGVRAAEHAPRASSIEQHRQRRALGRESPSKLLATTSTELRARDHPPGMVRRSASRSAILGEQRDVPVSKDVMVLKEEAEAEAAAAAAELQLGTSGSALSTSDIQSSLVVESPTKPAEIWAP